MKLWYLLGYLWWVAWIRIHQFQKNFWIAILSWICELVRHYIYRLFNINESRRKMTMNNATSTNTALVSDRPRGFSELSTRPRLMSDMDELMVATSCLFWIKFKLRRFESSKFFLFVKKNCVSWFKKTFLYFFLLVFWIHNFFISYFFIGTTIRKIKRIKTKSQRESK